MTAFISDSVFRFCEEKQDELVSLIRQIAVIPAFSGSEEKRAAFCSAYLAKHGISAAQDPACNVIWESGDCTRETAVFMAHTDVVFPDTTPLPLREDGPRLYAPGVGDDTANLAMLLLSMRYIHEKKLLPLRGGVIFVCNSGEEGLGNLRGSRQIAKDYSGRIRYLVSFDGSLGSIVNRAVGSRRYRITVKTEGGHSYGNFGNRNAIATLAEMITEFYSFHVPQGGRTTYNVGLIEGGTSVNTIAQSASMLFEFRSDCREDLAICQRYFDCVLETARAGGAEIQCELIGERPCSAPVDPTLQAELDQRAIDCQRAVLGNVKITASSGSTDCNIPLSTGIPAVCFGGYNGQGAHTREEWIDTLSLRQGFPAVLGMICQEYEA